MSHDELLAAGYRKNPPTPIWPYADCFYQKRFSDERGPRYFINILHYAPCGGLGESWSALLDCHSTPHRGAFEFRHNNPPDLKLAEYFAQKFWEEIAGYEYYEVNRES